ncbi:unnamed protein product [Brassicogethes aeneus]|uniref:Uncharacterized protein n=1 Tax=Brassicogethes aeneus TaxID=1431903 RepID=A0A9P0B0I7_BRAAE|nr:unnamed protein product [Brassicogethes aeneus]
MAIKSTCCTPNLIKNISICCVILSMWGFIQLMAMGLMFKFHSVNLLYDMIDDVDVTDEEEFYRELNISYTNYATNCFVVGVLYFVTFIISYVLYRKTLKKINKKKHDSQFQNQHLQHQQNQRQSTGSAFHEWREHKSHRKKSVP